MHRLDLGFPPYVDATVSLKHLLVLVRRPAELTLGHLVVVDPVAGFSARCRGLVFPQGSTDLALHWLDVVNVVDVIPGGQQPTNRTDLLRVILSLVPLQVSV